MSNYIIKLFILIIFCSFCQKILNFKSERFDSFGWAYIRHLFDGEEQSEGTLLSHL